MFNNIGEKIKVLAQLITWIGTVVSLFFGATFILNGAFIGEETSIGIGILIMLFGPLACWVFSWLIYGYGKLIENTNKLLVNDNSLASFIEKYRCSLTLDQKRENGEISQEDYEQEYQSLF